MSDRLPPMHCFACGRYGNEEDGCVVGDECPDEDCVGIIVSTYSYDVRLSEAQIDTIMGVLNTDDEEQDAIWQLLQATVDMGGEETWRLAWREKNNG